VRLEAAQMKDEGGSVLVEVMVSAILVTLAAIGVFNALDAATRSTAQERHRAQAHGLAQADLARMRTMRISDLSNFDETRQLVVDGTVYTVESVASFQTDATGTASCENGTAAADYIQIRSKVTWPSIGSRPPVVSRSLVAPPNGSVSAESGALAIQIENAKNEGIEGVGLEGSHEKGEDSFSGPTGINGCAIFGNLADGNYTLMVSPPPLVSELVDANGNQPEPELTSVVAEGTNTLVLQYDEPGTMEVEGQAWIGGKAFDTGLDIVVIDNSNMTGERVFGVPGELGPTVSATTLFPFESSYGVHAGSCSANSPDSAEVPEGLVSVADAFVTAGEITDGVTLDVPGLALSVWSGPDEADKGEPVEGATAVIEDKVCKDAEGKPIRRTYTTNAAGGLDDPGLPYGEYDICVEWKNGPVTNHINEPGVRLPEEPTDMQAGTVREFFTGNPGVLEGPCA